MFEFFGVYLGMSLMSRVHMVKVNFLLENLWISEPSLDVLEKFKCSSVLSKSIIFESNLLYVYVCIPI